MLTSLAAGSADSPPWIVEHWALLAITIACVSLLVFVNLVLAKYVRICLNIFCDTPPPPAISALEFQRLHGEMVRFRSFDGTSLRGMHLRPKGPHSYKGTIVFCHEFGADMYSCARYARPLIDAGFDVFTFDYRGHGESSNRGRYKPLQWPSDKELEDTLGALAYVEASLEAENKPQEIGLFGISRGAGSAILAASTAPNIKAVLVDGAFSTDLTVISLMKRWVHIFARVKLVYENHPDTFWNMMFWLLVHLAQPKLGCRYPSVQKALQDLRNLPMYFIYGGKDSWIRSDQASELFEQAPDPKHFWVVPKAKHNQAAVVESSQYAARSIAFFRKYLADEDVSEQEISRPTQTGVA